MLNFVKKLVSNTADKITNAFLSLSKNNNQNNCSENKLETTTIDIDSSLPKIKQLKRQLNINKHN